MRVAPDAGILIEVDDVVAGQVLEYEPVLVHEPRLEVGDEELDLALESTSGDEEGDEHVAEVVPRVGSEAVHREHHGRDGVPGGALRHRRRLGGVQRPDRDLVDVLQVLTGLVPDAPFLAVPTDDGWDVEDGAVGSDSTRVAKHLADVISRVGEVADWLAWRTCRFDVGIFIIASLINFFPDKLFLHPVTCIDHCFFPWLVSLCQITRRRRRRPRSSHGFLIGTHGRRRR
uniref:Uncharacterized protein n=1 Tax=Arundo donax TaxID=35708 RepID=A0A0A9CGR2_ARUDO